MASMEMKQGFYEEQIMERLFMEIMMDLWAGDVIVSYKLFIKEINKRISNLQSHIGTEAHQREAELGIIDETGMSLEQQDENLQKQINEYQELLEYLENDSNWTL